MSVKRAAIRCAAGLAALIVFAVSAFALIAKRPDLALPWVRRALTPRGGSASLAKLEISLDPPSIALSGLSIAWPAPGGDLLRLDRLRAEPIPGRLFGGGPWLRHVEANGLVFERPRPGETKGPPDLSPLNRLFDVEDLSMTESRLRIAFPRGELAADRLQVRMTPSGAGVRRLDVSAELAVRRNGATVAAGTLSAEGKVVPGPLLEVDLASANVLLDLPRLAGRMIGQATLKVSRSDLLADPFTLFMPDALVRLAEGPRKRIGPIRLGATAGATLDGKNPHIEVRSLDVGGLLHAGGKIGGPGWEDLAVTAAGSIRAIDRWKPLLDSVLPGVIAGVDPRGSLPFRLTLSAPGRDRVLEVNLLPRDLAISHREAGLDGRIGGSLLLKGRLAEWAAGRIPMVGRLQGSGRFERGPLDVRRFGFDVPLAGRTSHPTFPGWGLTVGAGDLLYEGRPLPIGKLDLRGSAGPFGDAFRVGPIEIRSEVAGRVTGDLSFRGGSVGGRMSAERMPVEPLVPLVRALGATGVASWSPTGAADVAVLLDPAAGGPRMTAAVTFDRLGFASPSGDVMGRDLRAGIQLDADLGPRPRIKGDLALRQGETLWGTVYADFGKAPVVLHVEGTRPAPGEYTDLLLEGGSDGFGRLTLSGNARREGTRWSHRGRIAVRDARLGPIFRTFLKDPLSTSHPAMEKADLDGTAGIDLSFSGSGNAAVLSGELRLRSGEVRTGTDPPFLSGLDVDLPIAYSLGAANPGRPRPAAAEKWGRIRLDRVFLDGRILGPFDVPAVLVPNHLYLGGTVDLPVFGANVSLRRIQVDEPLSPKFRVRMSARLDGLDLARLAGKDPSLEGHLGGILDPVVIDRERGTAGGALTGDLFGGRMEVRRVAVDRPFAPGREIGADIEVSLLDLERFSAALGVGRVTGRLSGTLKGMRIAYGQPVAFHLKMESVPVKGVKQSVSLKAVNSISLVGTGSGLSGLGVSLMTKIFREFSYEKIGFECRLENDVFAVRGLIHEDGVEYLVKRRFFSGIDVVNANADNRIGFSDMLDRAKRVTGERSR